MLRVKETKKLFYGKYQYKIVLVSPGASLFRSNNLDKIRTQLRHFELSPDVAWKPKFWIRTQNDLDSCLDLVFELSKIKDYTVRVEHPWISIYSNNKADIDSLAELNHTAVKYICIPYVPLSKGVIVMTDTPYDFKVTISPSKTDHSSFVSWADSSKHVKLTPHCRHKLLQTKRFVATYFYLNGENNLLLAKMHLGSDVQCVEKIVNRSQSEKV